MLKIAVFDEKRNAEEIENLLVNVLFNKCEFGYEAFINPNTAAKIDFKNFDFDIAFIATDYMEIAKKLREGGNIKTELILVSDTDSFALRGYKFKTFDYLISPTNINSIFETLDRYFYYFEDEDKFFTFKNSGNLQKVNVDNIFYFTSDRRKTKIMNSNNEPEAEFYSKLSDIKSGLNEDFISIHQSYITNIRYIKSITKNSVELTNGIELPVSQKYASEVKRRFLDYINAHK